MHFDVRFRGKLAPVFLWDADAGEVPSGMCSDVLEVETIARHGFAYFPHLEREPFMRVFVDEDPAAELDGVVGEHSLTGAFVSRSGKLVCGQLGDRGAIELQDVPAIEPGVYAIAAYDIDAELLGRKQVAERRMTKADYRAYRLSWNIVATLAGVAFISFFMASMGLGWLGLPLRGKIAVVVSAITFAACAYGLVRAKSFKYYQRGEQAWERLLRRTPSLVVQLTRSAPPDALPHQPALCHKPSYEPYFPDQTD